MIATPTAIEPAVLLPPAPAPNGTNAPGCHGSSGSEASRASEPTPTPASPSPRLSSVPLCLSAYVPSSPPLTSRDEELIYSLLESGPSLAHLIRQHKMTLDQALAWWRQPHIKAALAELADLSQARAKAIASNDAMQAVSALQSSLVLCESEFYEQADPKTRLKAFDSARKAAVQVLKLAGISGNSRAPSRAITRGSARVMPRADNTDPGPGPAPSSRPVPPRPIRSNPSNTKSPDARSTTLPRART